MNFDNTLDAIIAAATAGAKETENKIDDFIVALMVEAITVPSVRDWLRSLFEGDSEPQALMSMRRPLELSEGPAASVPWLLIIKIAILLLTRKGEE